MSDGRRVSAMADGMGCIQDSAGNLVLMRNHEIPRVTSSFAGGVSRLVVNPQSLAVVSSNIVLFGTSTNCGGGWCPQGWLTCEEVRDGAVYLCDPLATGLTPSSPLEALGRFKHEAAEAHSPSGEIFMTEDEEDSCLYRFVPDSHQTPFSGRLQALVAIDRNGLDTRRETAVGDEWECRWVDIADPSGQSASVRRQAQLLGAAVFSRGEGLVVRGDSVYFTATDGGPVGRGQVFEFLRVEANKGMLKVLAQSESAADLDCPDAICVSPQGQLFVAEDGQGEQFIRQVMQDGTFQSLARNALSDSEFAGLCFSPDGSTLFLNIQADGLTLMVTGPFLNPHQ